jgi:hypothetical protein
MKNKGNKEPEASSIISPLFIVDAIVSKCVKRGRNIHNHGHGHPMAAIVKENKNKKYKPHKDKSKSESVCGRC